MLNHGPQKDAGKRLEDLSVSSQGEQQVRAAFTLRENQNRIFLNCMQWSE